MNQALRMIYGKEQTQLIFIAAQLGIADLLKGGVKSIEELADATDSHLPTLNRVMRALVSQGIFAEPRRRCFALAPEAEPLLTDHPQSIRNYAIYHGSHVFFEPYSNALRGVRAGKSAFEHTYGVGLYQYLQEHPDAAALFDAGQTDLARMDAEAVVEAYDFSRFRTVADLGGGAGLLLTTILKTQPLMKGIALDLPSVAQAARRRVENEGLSDRCQVIAGDFFEAVPENVDLYVLKHIVMDWDDERAAAILRNCRNGIASDGRVLIIQSLIPEDTTDGRYPMSDIRMFVLTGGRERTEAEYRDLYSMADFRLNRIIPTGGAVSLIEGVAT